MAPASVTEPLLRVLSPFPLRAWAVFSATVVASAMTILTSATAPVIAYSGA